MTADGTPTRFIDRWSLAIGLRRGMLLLVAIHLGVALLQSWPLPYQLERWAPSSYGFWGILIGISEAILCAQVALIAAYLTLGAGRWWLRLIVGPLLLLAFVLAQMFGTYWLDAGRDSRGFQEFLAHYLWMLALVAAPLLAYRFVARHQFARPASSQSSRWQFQILDLLLITALVAALLAVIRGYVAWESDWPAQLWSGIREYPKVASYDALALFVFAAAPAVLVAAQLRSLRRAAVFAFVWEAFLAGGFAGYLLLLGGSNPAFDIQSPAPMWVNYVVTIFASCFTTAGVIWLTLAAVRWLGYDFRPLPRGGRHSSDATSAA